MTTETQIGEEQWVLRGEQIKKARGFLHYSHEYLAELMSEVLGYKIGRQVIYNLEQGERDIKAGELQALSIVLQQSEDWLNGKSGAVYNDSAKNRISVLGLTTHRPLLRVA